MRYEHITAGKKNQPPALSGGISVLVPAYNEAASVADTIRSLHNQTIPIDEIIVIDDFSSDGTGDVARALGVTVVVPPRNTGSKAGAQNFGLQFVATELTMAIDADTTLAPDAIEKLLPAFADPRVAAACGFVLPRHVRTLWERGRYVEYLFAFSFYKPIQDFYTKPLISSGCFSLYRTAVLKKNGGWAMRTPAEDMDLTWTYYQQGYRVRFLPTAVSYPIEPHNFEFMRKQLKRWSHGFIQNVLLHWHGIRNIPYLNYTVTVALWDAGIASLAYLILLPLLALIFRNPLFLLGYVIDIPAVIVPTLGIAIKRREVCRLLLSLPAFFVVRAVNGLFMLEALWTELILKRRFDVYEKGH
ncbi:MAG: glycosyltransferase family 2 protein [Candidatus Omnitrophica bacterium]|nr:glycosyltransferase family 2 protein [Candidatus Omnitrophota bacterium]